MSSYEESLAAVKRDGMALQYVQEQTEEICLAAIEEDPWALEYVKEQTEEICLAAIKQNGYALKFVREQTLELYLEAVKKDIDALLLVPEEFIENDKLLTEEQILAKYTIEELLTSSHAWLRKKGKEKERGRNEA